MKIGDSFLVNRQCKEVSAISRQNINYNVNVANRKYVLKATYHIKQVTIKGQMYQVQFQQLPVENNNNFFLKF